MVADIRNVIYTCFELLPGLTYFLDIVLQVCAI